MTTRQVKRAFKYRFHPTDAQAAELSRTFGCVRKVYNLALAARSEAWALRQERVNYNATSVMLTSWKKTEELGYLSEVSSVPLQQTLRHLQGAFGNFWQKRAKYPTFKSKKKSRRSAEERAGRGALGDSLWSWCKTSTEFSGRAVGDEAENPTARAVGIPLLQEGEDVKLFRNAARTSTGTDDRAGARRPARTGLRTGALAVVVAAALVSCTQASSGDGPGADVPAVSADPAADRARIAAEAEKTDQAEREAAAEESAVVPTPGPALVRDAFATLQATLNDTCTPGAGDCAYFLGRVTRELTELDESMRADAKGPGHFKQPLADMKILFDKLGDDRSEAHLEKYFSEIVGTRDGINTWMQDHPDDYR